MPVDVPQIRLKYFLAKKAERLYFSQVFPGWKVFFIWHVIFN